MEFEDVLMITATAKALNHLKLARLELEAEFRDLRASSGGLDELDEGFKKIHWLVKFLWEQRAQMESDRSPKRKAKHVF